MEPARHEPHHSRRGIAIAAAAVFVLLATSGAAQARTEFGVVPQDGALPSADDLRLMSHGGAKAIRLMAHWPTAQPTKAHKYNWTTLDGMVREATKRGVKPFFFLYGTPDWAVAKDGRNCAPGACSTYPPDSPATRKAFAAFASAAVKRYGPGGSFWRKPKAKASPMLIGPVDPCTIDPTLPGCTPPPAGVCDLNPTLPGCPPPPEGPGTTPPPPPPPTEPPGPNEPPCGCTKAHPIRVWQIWNEQNSPKYFAPKVDVKKYAKLLKVANAAIKKADPGAEVVLGGMWGPDSAKKVVTPISTYLKQLYAVNGAKQTFDSIGLHPYSSSASGSLAQLDTARRVANGAGDRGAGIWVTEIGWASGGPADEPYVKGAKGQAQILSQALGKMASRQHRYNLRGVFWYSWRDKEGGDKICVWCGDAGLRALDGSSKPAWKAFSRLAKR
ncbi:MAG: polysaccharide biosynthesis protein PslG [Solirubrobacterales bacterium]|jgi:hypothetical protein|nr:polysaccharide biosynthesis protein PslG [Solirubrobacterales bacterium]